ncbi:MAG: stage V sporulation protein D [Erysipelotrichaceae bacterium]|nr:stage V sporulation protein D [Erysipelotrichaceae bacterium]
MQEYKSIYRIKIFKIIIIFSFFLISFKLAYLQLYKSNELASKALESWQRSFPIEAPRGIIYDCNGSPLVINQPVMSVAVIPFQIKDKENTAKYLANILQVEYDIIFKKITKKASIVKIYPEGKQISIQQAKTIDSLDLKGVYLIQDSMRYYPYNNLLSHTIGFVGLDNQGLAGIENKYEQYLKGKNGNLNYIMDAKGGLFNSYASELVFPSSGMSLQLTIDLGIQQIVERELSNAYLKYNPESILALAMNPNTGEIRAIASYPNYNPNEYQKYDSSIYNQNLPIWKSFEPGSTFKGVIFAAGLEEKKFDMYKDTYYDSGTVNVEGFTIKSWKKGGHGLQTFLEVLQNSSNPGMVEISNRLGNDKMYEYITKFGFGSKTGIDIVGETTGILFQKEYYGALEQATSSFGQGISSSAIQLVNAYAALVNGGYLLEPYIVKSIIHTSTNDVIYERETTIKDRVISQETSSLMRDALEHVTALGSGRKAYIEGYRIGSKTGTSQKVVDGKYSDTEYILSMITVSPINDPQLVLYIAMDAPKSTIQYGGTTIGPIMQKMLSEILPYMGIKKQKNELTKDYTWMDIKEIEIPNYIGFDKSKVKSQNLKFTFIGEGNIVIDQLPSPGNYVDDGGTVLIMLG